LGEILDLGLRCLVFPRTGLEKGPSSLSVMQSRKNLMRAQVVALVLDAEEVCLTFIVLFSSVRRKKFAQSI
jgi:hypothetical protein